LQAVHQGNISWSVVKEPIVSSGLGFGFPTNHYFFKSFNWKIHQLVESGIADYIVDKSDRLTSLRLAIANANKMKYDDIPLSFFHVNNWFYGLLILLCLAIIVFLLEIPSKKVENVRVFDFVP
jgi:hypothetical protein